MARRGRDGGLGALAIPCRGFWRHTADVTCGNIVITETTEFNQPAYITTGAYYPGWDARRRTRPDDGTYPVAAGTYYVTWPAWDDVRRTTSSW